MMALNLERAGLVLFANRKIVWPLVLPEIRLLSFVKKEMRPVILHDKSAASSSNRNHLVSVMLLTNTMAAPTRPLLNSSTRRLIAGKQIWREYGGFIKTVFAVQSC